MSELVDLRDVKRIYLQYTILSVSVQHFRDWTREYIRLEQCQLTALQKCNDIRFVHVINRGLSRYFFPARTIANEVLQLGWKFIPHGGEVREEGEIRGEEGDE